MCIYVYIHNTHIWLYMFQAVQVLALVLIIRPISDSWPSREYYIKLCYAISYCVIVYYYCCYYCHYHYCVYYMCIHYHYYHYYYHYYYVYIYIYIYTVASAACPSNIAPFSTTCPSSQKYNYY